MNAALWLLLSLATACAQRGDFHVPTTISDEAAAVLDPMKRLPPISYPGPDDLDTWKTVWDAYEALTPMAVESAMEQYRPEVESRLVGGVPVLDVKPQGWTPSDRVAVYAHGGGYVLGSAKSFLPYAASVANDTGIRVVSVDYTVAPAAKWGEVTRQMVAVIEGLVEEGHCLDRVAVYGDSAGAGLVAGSVLRMRDEGRGMPAAVVLWSPWSDVTGAGDTVVTLADHDPVLGNSSLGAAAASYADPRDHLNPYVSPVHGNYSKGFPPTLIQVTYALQKWTRLISSAYSCSLY